MNTNIILDGFNAMLKQLIASAVADAVKPLQERIAVLEAAYTDWKAMEHVAAKAMQPLQDRVIALEINQTLVREGHNDFSEAMRNLLIGYDFIKRNEVVDLVDTVVTNAIEAYDFSDSFDFESAIENYDFSEIIEANTPNELDKDVVEEMIYKAIDEALNKLVIVRE